MSASTRVASFAFIPFLNAPAIRTVSAESTSDTPNASDLGATLTVNADGTVNYDPSTSATIQGAPAGSILTDTFKYTTVSLTGQLTSATVTVTVAEGDIVDLVNGKLSISSGPGIDSNFSTSFDGTNFTITDTATIFSLTQGAIDAGITGAGTNTIVCPASLVSEFALDLGNGNDTLGAVNAGALPLTLKSSGTLSISGTVATTFGISVIAPDIAAAASGHLVAPTVSLTGSNSIGTSGNNVQTQADTIAVNVGDGGAFVTEADGATVSGTATGTGGISIANLTGTLAVGDTIATATGPIVLSSGDGITLDADLDTAGTITIAANTDGAGSEGFNQKAASISTTDFSASAASITVNTAGGGTGDAIIGRGSVGLDSGGTLTVSSNGGNILWSDDPFYTAFGGSQTGLTNGGSNAQVLRAFAANFSTGANGSVGTDERPLQLDNFGINSTPNSVANLTAAAGSGGVFATVWDAGSNHDLTTGNISATGAGNIRVVAANATGHNIWVEGSISAESGSILLGADDNFVIGPNVVIGGAGFSGTVWMQGNRDQATAGQPFTMDATSSVVTSNTTNVDTAGRNPTTQAVYIDMSGRREPPRP